MRSCAVVGAGEDVETFYTVQCPRRQEATAFERCCGCSHKIDIEVALDGTTGSVECFVPGDTNTRPRVDVAEAAVRVRLGEIIGLSTTSVRNDIRLEAVAELLVEKNLRAVPVVDENRRLVGMVSKTELLRPTSSRRRPKTIVEVMTPLTHGLPEDSPVAYAISLMATESLHELPVVDGKGQLVGMLSATDALRWLAQSLGYVLPASSAAKAEDKTEP